MRGWQSRLSECETHLAKEGGLLAEPACEGVHGVHGQVAVWTARALPRALAHPGSSSTGQCAAYNTACSDCAAPPGEIAVVACLISSRLWAHTAGKKVVVLESRTRGAGQTGRTTAHIMTWVRARGWMGPYAVCAVLWAKQFTSLGAGSVGGCGSCLLWK